MKLIVGLGNPGDKYTETRHNLGFMVVQHLVRSLGLRWRSGRCYQGMVAEGRYQDQPCLLLMPLTYMNHSGAAVKDLALGKDISANQIFVVCDDYNLDFGQMRLRTNGSDGGHNGLSSIIALLGTEDFARLRMGIGQPPPQVDAVDYVLARFLKEEKKQLEEFVSIAAECSLLWLTDDVNKVMSQFNKRMSYE